jgi:hypothetical protein
MPELRGERIMNIRRNSNQGPTTAVRRSRLRLRVATCLASLAAVGACALIASPAQASVAYAGGVGSASISCNGNQSIYKQINISPMAGYSSQWRAYRMYVLDVNTGHGSWSDWNILAPSQKEVGWMTFPHGTFRFYVQYAWWNGTSWIVPNGEWLNTYTYSGGYSWQQTQNSCFT